MSSGRSLNKLSKLLIRKLSDGLTDAEHALLKNWLAEDAEARQYYVEFVSLNAHLRQQRVALFGSAALNIDLAEDDPNRIEAHVGLPEDTEQVGKSQASGQTPERVDDIRRIAEQRLRAFMEEEDQIRQQQAQAQQRFQAASLFVENLQHMARRINTTATWVLRNAVRLAIIAIIVLVGVAVVEDILSQRIIATLDETVNAHWDRPPADPNLSSGPMFLSEGFAKITFKQGAGVVLQAPCSFELSSKNRMILHQGTITAQVPAQAHGFAIKMPQSTVTDFGTEFGVQVQDSAASEVHVFNGSVEVKTAAHSKRRSQRREITQGKAAVITNRGELNVGALGARPNLFMRDIPDPNSYGIPSRRVDLADIVGGGSGFGTGSRYACIDPVTGKTAATYRHEQRTGGAGYIRVPSLSFVDGVFVPPAEGGLFPISTAGHHFDFPQVAGKWYLEIAHAGEANLRQSPRAFLTLDGQTYGIAGHPAILMHANLGITFDLDAIRASLTGIRIKSFTSACGISTHVRKTQTPDALFYVLVDGQTRFYRKIQLPSDPVATVRIDLRQDEQFLTLVCLAGADNAGDWTLFGVPALELEGELE